MSGPRLMRPVVRDQQQRLGGRQPFALGMQRRQPGLQCPRLPAKPLRQLREVAGDHPGRPAGRLRLQGRRQLRNPRAVARHQRIHRHPQRRRQSLVVHVHPGRASHVHHVEHHKDGMPQLDHLRGVVEIPLKVRGVHHHQDQVRRGHLGLALEEDIPRDALVRRLRAQAVRARQVQHQHRIAPGRPQQRALLPLHRHSRVVAHLRPKPRQRVEERRLPAVRVARQHHQERPRGLAMRPHGSRTITRSASCRRNDRW